MRVGLGLFPLAAVRRWLQNEYLDGEVGIIAVSAGGAFYDIDFLETAKKLGADAILRKLDPKERVLAEIDRLLDRQVD